jgi:hypothetical protein
LRSKKDFERKEGKEFDLTEVYENEIVPEMCKFSELLDKYGFPHLIHIVFKIKDTGKAEETGCGLINHPHHSGSEQIKKMCVASNMLSDKRGVVPVPVDPKNPAAILAALALAATSIPDE